MAMETRSSQPAAPRSSSNGGPLTRYSRLRGPFARIMTVVIIAFVFAMMSLIYWRWARVHEPSTAVVVEGDQTLDGAKIEVQDNDAHWDANLNAGNNFSTPVLLEPGRYSIHVTHRNHQILNARFSVDRTHAYRYLLRPAVPVIGSSLSGNMQVTVDGDTDDHRAVHVEPITLDAGNRFRDTLYLTPGDYRATASRNGKVVAVQSFRVDRGKPAEVDVARPAAAAE
jgi:hypothetical protein